MRTQSLFSIRIRNVVFIPCLILGLLLCRTFTAESSTQVTIQAMEDNYLKKDNKSQNKGPSAVLKISEASKSHVIVQFDQAEIAAAVNGGTVVEARLKLYIEQNWGGFPTAGRRVDIYRLTADWEEMASSWNCAVTANCSTPEWDGGLYAASVTDHTNYFNETIGWTNFDVTADVNAFLSGTSNFGWLIRKTDSHLSGDVDYSSVQATDPTKKPYLLLTVEPNSDCDITYATNPGVINGWYGADVIVTPQCEDADGVGYCTPQMTIVNAGQNTVRLECEDSLGRYQFLDVPINIDKTQPELTILYPPEGAPLTAGDVAVSGTTTDTPSGTRDVICNTIPASTSVVATVANGVFACEIAITSAHTGITATAYDYPGNNTSDNASIQVREQEPPRLILLDAEITPSGLSEDNGHIFVDMTFGVLPPVSQQQRDSLDSGEWEIQWSLTAIAIVNVSNPSVTIGPFTETVVDQGESIDYTDEQSVTTTYMVLRLQRSYDGVAHSEPSVEYVEDDRYQTEANATLFVNEIESGEDSIEGPKFAVLLDAQHSRAARSSSAEALAEDFLDVQQVIPQDSALVPIDTESDDLGYSHIRYQQYFGDLKVFSGEYIAHVDDLAEVALDDRETDALRRNIAIQISPPSYTGQQAAAVAYQELFSLGESVQGPAELLLYPVDESLYVLAYYIESEVQSEPGTRSWIHFIDANSGEVVEDWDNTQTGIAKTQYSGDKTISTTSQDGVYVLKDPNRGSNGGNETRDMSNGDTSGNGALYRDNCIGTPPCANDDIWGDNSRFVIGGATDSVKGQTDAADAHWGMQKTWDYFVLKQGRNGIDGSGSQVSARVHISSLPGNAQWVKNKKAVFFYHNMPYPELVGHEFTHGVIDSSARLVYRGEPGGLNESTADIFGVMIEAYGKGSTIPDWQIQSVNRRMDLPSASGGGGADFWFQGVGSLDPHVSSGVGNHFLYYLSNQQYPAACSGATGISCVTVNCAGPNAPAVCNCTAPVHCTMNASNSSCPSYCPQTVPTCGGAYDKKSPHLPCGMTGIAPVKAAKIWYRALTRYMTSSSTYRDARYATLLANGDLYGNTEGRALINAWRAVNVLPPESACRPRECPPEQ